MKTRTQLLEEALDAANRLIRPLLIGGMHEKGLSRLKREFNESLTALSAAKEEPSEGRAAYYRLLNDGEKILPTDQHLKEWFNTWENASAVPYLVGREYHEEMCMPIRRLVHIREEPCDTITTDKHSALIDELRDLLYDQFPATHGNIPIRMLLTRLTEVHSSACSLNPDTITLTRGFVAALASHFLNCESAETYRGWQQMLTTALSQQPTKG